MSISPKGLNIQALYRRFRDGELVVNRQYQRKLVWTIEEKQKLIDSILKGYPIPLFLLAARKDANAEDGIIYEVIDGMQRLHSIFSFIEHSYHIDRGCFDLAQLSRARQARDAGVFVEFDSEVRRLSEEESSDFLEYMLAVTEFPGDDEGRITDIFGRINSGGRQLSDQERRQAGVLSSFAEVVRSLSAEIRGDVSRERLKLNEMPEISVETQRQPQGFGLRAEDIFWCFQGVLRTNELRESGDEQLIADICASIVNGEPVKASGAYLDKIYNPSSDEAGEIDGKLAAFGADRLKSEVKMIFSLIRTTLSDVSTEKNFFRSVVYPTPTSNSQKSPFFATFIAFYNLVFVEGMTPADSNGIIESLQNLSDAISVGQKNVKVDQRKNNIAKTDGLIRRHFVKTDVAAISHGPGAIFDFENSLRRSRTETPRYEFKQGLVRLDGSGEIEQRLVAEMPHYICALANAGPDADGYMYIGIADTEKDAKRKEEVYGTNSVMFQHLHILGVDSEAIILKEDLDQYLRRIIDTIRNSELSDPLKTSVLSSVDVITYKDRSVVRIRVPRQKNLSFVGDKTYLRSGNSLREATAKESVALGGLFS